ncbi:MAG TPA: hypothetical protein VHQ64_10945 [Pyrinomonadaceae bacterium]|jgi:hypothetical protein|nr:hypothetical protein [Pyrinomonadaceae bacterium]
MPKKTIIVAFLLIGCIAAAVGLIRRSSTTHANGEVAIPAIPPSILQPTPGVQSPGSPGIPPPRRTSDALVRESSPEPQRALVGSSTEQLNRIEQYLPPASRIAKYPINESQQMAAQATADLAGNRGLQTIVVYEAPASQNENVDGSLVLSVLTATANGFEITSSSPLKGGLIYVNLSDDQAVPFAVRDVTGDGRPEIIVTSGVGASLGGAMQIYSFDGASLRQIAFIAGHTLRMANHANGRAAEILAQSRYESKPRHYVWNGRVFARDNS